MMVSGKAGIMLFSISSPCGREHKGGDGLFRQMIEGAYHIRNAGLWQNNAKRRDFPA